MKNKDKQVSVVLAVLPGTYYRQVTQLCFLNTNPQCEQPALTQITRQDQHVCPSAFWTHWTRLTCVHLFRGQYPQCNVNGSAVKSKWWFCCSDWLVSNAVNSKCHMLSADTADCSHRRPQRAFTRTGSCSHSCGLQDNFSCNYAYAPAEG